jgi:hypothetical protein
MRRPDPKHNTSIRTDARGGEFARGFERERILDARRACNLHRVKAAELSGMTRRTHSRFAWVRAPLTNSRRPSCAVTRMGAFAFACSRRASDTERNDRLVTSSFSALPFALGASSSVRHRLREPQLRRPFHGSGRQSSELGRQRRDVGRQRDVGRSGRERRNVVQFRRCEPGGFHRRSYGWERRHPFG